MDQTKRLALPFFKLSFGHCLCGADDGGRKVNTR
jgi:hypothetical protein